jgi:hypothetical protein
VCHEAVNVLLLRRRYKGGAALGGVQAHLNGFIG